MQILHDVTGIRSLILRHIETRQCLEAWVKSAEDEAAKANRDREEAAKEAAKLREELAKSREDLAKSREDLAK